MSKNPYISKVK